MCGIHGLINLDTTYFSDGPKYIHDGFVAGSLRGMDSSGIFQLDKKYVPFVHKDAKSGSQFIGDGVTKAFISDAARSPLTLCHVRAATVGNVKKDNAHPFVVSDQSGKRLIGVHNGTLYNWGNKKNAKDFTVDSNWAMKHISEEGIEAFKDFSGAFCFAWWDEHNPTKFYMARNSQRPMHFMVSKDKKKLIFGSEAMMVAWLAERNKISVEPEVYSLEENRLYSFDLDAKEITFTKGADELPRFSGTTSTSGWTGGRTWDSRAAQYSGVSGYDEGDWGDYAEAYGVAGSRTNSVYDDDGVSHSGLNMISSLAMILDSAKSELDSANEAVATVLAEQSELSLVPKQLPAITSDDIKQKKDELTAGDPISNDMILPPTHYSTASATVVERNAARSLGVMGELQWLQGVAFDPDQCSVLGFLEDFLPGKGVVQYDAELRHTTAAQADRKYINNKSEFGKSGDWVVIIGATTDKQTNNRLFIVAPLNDEGRRHMLNNRH